MHRRMFSASAGDSQAVGRLKFSFPTNIESHQEFLVTAGGRYENTAKTLKKTHCRTAEEAGSLTSGSLTSCVT